jgi:hypothetical protein
VNEIYKDKLEILRQRLPVGLRHGLILLEKANGDVEQAVELFQQEMRVLVINKTGVTEDIATKHLIKTSFDIDLALKSIDEERYSLTERILRRYTHNKEQALEKLADTIEKEHELIRDFWLDFEDLQRLPQEVFCLLTIVEWLNYEGWEGFDSAIYFHTDVVTDQIERQLLLPAIAKAIKTAKEIHESQFEQQKMKLEREGAVGATPEFREQEDLFNEQKPLLIAALYEFVKRHMDKFP